MNLKDLGTIVFLLYSQKAEDKRQAYIEWFRLKNTFPEQFEKEVEKLEQYRAERGAFSIVDRVQQIRNELVKNGFTVDDKPNQKGDRMNGLKKIGNGLITIGEGLIELAESGVFCAPKAEEKKTVPVPAKKQEEKPAVQEEKPAVQEVSRDQVTRDFLALVKKSKETAISLLAEFGAKKLTGVPDAELDAFNTKLAEAING